MKINFFKPILFLAALSLCHILHAQGYSESGQANNYIPTGMPILQIAPDAISGALGDAGVAAEPDAYSSHWNNAKFAFAPQNMAISTTYTPWLHKLDHDMNFLYLGGYKRINQRSTVGASLTYFSMGDITHTGELGDDLGEFHPNEFAFDGTYSMKLSDNLSLGATGRYVHSDLTQGLTIGDERTKAANSLAADVGLYFQQSIDKNQSFALGMLISNLGSKLSYSDDDTDNEFLPANLRVGGRYTYEMDDYNKVNILLDLNKQLVPTPPMVNDDGTYSGYYTSMADYHQTSSMLGAIQSFYDAPGGLKEELHEITIGGGAEYWYANILAARMGYFYEHHTKGGRQYLTFGIGIRYNVVVFDFSYLVPTTNFSNNPLANTLRVSIGVNFASGKKK